MSFFDRVKEMLVKNDSIKDRKDDIISAKDYDELIEIIKRIKRVNDVQVREIEREIDKLSAIEAEEIKKIKSGDLIERKKKLALLTIRRIRREISIYDRKIEIHSKNIDTHQSIIGTVEEIKSKEMLGVSEDLIMKVIESAAKRDEKFQEVINTANAIEFTAAPVLSASDKAELDAIEKEILSDLNANDEEIDKKIEQEISSPQVSNELADLEQEIMNAPEKTNDETEVADKDDNEKKLELE